MKLVLFNPRIPHNTGAIVRLCAVTGHDLALVPPLGFSLASRHLKRAGLDYWEGVRLEIIDDLESRLIALTSPFYFFSSRATQLYTEAKYTADSWLIFGSETAGLPTLFLERWSDRFVTIPMLPGKRCLNLALSASIALYEAWRQQSFKTPD